MNRNVVIIGAGGHGSVIADIVSANGDTVLGFLDDDVGRERLGSIEEWKKFSEAEFVLGVGSAKIRERISSEMDQNGLSPKWYTAIHPSAVVSPKSKIGDGTVVMPNAVINSGAVIGRHCIINSGAVVEHDNRLEDFVHVSVGAKLGGTVSVEKGSWIGIGAVVSNNLSICGNCMIGAGAVVVQDIKESGTYIGIPAKWMGK